MKLLPRFFFMATLALSSAATQSADALFKSPVNGVPSPYAAQNWACWTHSAATVYLTSCSGDRFWNVPLTVSWPIQYGWYAHQPAGTTMCGTVYTYSLTGTIFAKSAERCGGGPFSGGSSGVPGVSGGSALINFRANKNGASGHPGISSVNFI